MVEVQLSKARLRVSTARMCEQQACLGPAGLAVCVACLVPQRVRARVRARVRVLEEWITVG